MVFMGAECVENKTLVIPPTLLAFVLASFSVAKTLVLLLPPPPFR